MELAPSPYSRRCVTCEVNDTAGIYGESVLVCRACYDRLTLVADHGAAVPNGGQMSSTYRILCLSHDPALVLVGEWPSLDEALSAVASRTLNASSSNIGHRDCDLVVGAYSYPLVRLWCPPCQSDQPRWGHTSYHPNKPIAVNAFWLRLLWHVDQQQASATLAKTLAGRPGCWNPGRLTRLRCEL
jgi:hypothetical protein